MLWLALSRLAAVIVPINPSYTAPEIEHVVTKSEVTHFVADVAYIDAAEVERRRPVLDGQVISVREEEGAETKGTLLVPVWLDDKVAHGHYDGYCKTSEFI